MLLKEIKPSPQVAEFVRLYRIIDFTFPDNGPIPPKLYTPRPEHCLQFFLTPTNIDVIGKHTSIQPKNALLSGQHTFVNSRTVYRNFLSLQVVFVPGALYRLFGLSAVELTDHFIEAEDIFGLAIEEITQRLYDAAGHQEMIDIVEEFIMKLARNTKRVVAAIDLVAQQMLSLGSSLDDYVSAAFLCHRQFDRQFIRGMGITPKEYLRIVRFDQAFRMKNASPQMSWFNIAIACGYYDYQHLSKDYKSFTGYSPSKFFAMDSPERQLGSEEIY
ncbi:helix-turn-helix domain-containing protein [Nubsella zeaxanthinifaciens]|uniref:helix-turn-helix domain-containing protein n=1 Tax=Nubsella zeaxanthinifaciens TaxID=392412 RepID=UPI000DE2ED75|nr:helix-turn-helix domain-containing protein [Nubsella zeaxanthinifaciens]